MKSYSRIGTRKKMNCIKLMLPHQWHLHQSSQIGILIDGEITGVKVAEMEGGGTPDMEEIEIEEITTGISGTTNVTTKITEVMGEVGKIIVIEALGTIDIKQSTSQLVTMKCTIEKSLNQLKKKTQDYTLIGVCSLQDRPTILYSTMSKLVELLEKS